MSVVHPGQDALVGVGPDGGIRNWSPGAEDLYGWSAAEAIGQQVGLLDADVDPTASLFVRALGGECLRVDCVRHLHRDGQVVPVSLLVSPMLAASGAVDGVNYWSSRIAGTAPPRVPVGVVDALRDTEQQLRDAQAETLESGLRLHELTRSIETGVFLRDPQQMLYMNPGFLRIFGIDPDSPEHTVPDIMSMIHADDREVAEEITAGADSGVRTVGEVRIVRATGEVRWIRATNDPITRPDGSTRVAGTIEDITEPKYTELLLRQSEERFLQLATNVKVGFNLYGINPSRPLYANPAFHTMFGFDPQGPLPTGEQFLSHIHPDDQRLAVASRHRVGDGQLAEYDARIISPGGGLQWVRATMNPILDSAGVVVRVACLFEDITERKKTEVTLLESDRRFRQLAGSLDVGISLRQIDPPVYLYVNPRYIALTGFDPSLVEPTDAAAQSPIHPDDHDRMLTEYWNPSRSGRAGQSEFRIIDDDGGIRWLRATCHPIIDDHLLPSRVAGTIEDITQWKAAESALLESERRFYQLAVNVKVGFSLMELTDPPKIVYVNPAFLQILGIARSEFTPDGTDSMASVIHPDDAARVAQNAIRLSRGEQIDDEVRILRPNGEIRWIRYLRSPVIDDAGRAFRAAGTTEDVTDRRTAEAAVQSARAEAVRANRAKSEFLSKMSHELRTPLNAVLGFAQLLGLEELTDSQQEFVGHILRGGRHLLAMINDVLDISGIEAERLEVTIEPIHVTSLITETIELIRPLAVEAGVELTFATSKPHSGYVLADERRMRQVLLNLLSNAIKYNRRPGWVSVSCQPDDDTHLRVLVSDSGFGIRPEDMSRLFTPFERLGQERAEIEGTGIGLALSQRLVAAMDGRIEARSELDVGTTFAIILPTAVSTAPARTAAAATAIPTKADGISVATLLYIEDNLSNLQLVQRIIARRPQWGMVHTALGKRGIEMAGQHHPTLIMLDLHLPDLNGIDVLTRLRADPKTASIPVVVASADASPQQVARLQAAGVDGYVTKPLDVSLILRLLDQFAERAGVSQA